MRPEILRVFGWPIHGYGLMIVIGFILCTYLANQEARRRKLPDFVYDFGLVMLFAGIFGGRLFHYIENYSAEFSGRSVFAFFAIWEGGLVFYGGAVAGFLAGLVYLKRRGLPILDCLDATASFVPIGMAFGRLGCFMNGCCFGKICSPDGPFALVFPKVNKGESYSPAFLSQLQSGLVVPSDPSPLPVYPVQLYEAAYDFLLCGVLYWFLRGTSPRGSGYPLLFTLYGIGRFVLEFYRADNPDTWTGFTISQNLSLALVLVFLPLLIYYWLRNLRPVHLAEEKSQKKS